LTYNDRNHGIDPEGFNDEDSRWRARNFGNKGHFILTLEAEYSTMTGAAVSENFYIPYPHRMVHFEAKHTDADGLNNTTALATAVFTVDKRWKTTTAASKWFIEWDFAGVVASDFVRSFGDTNERPISHYEITVNTTEDHLMYYEVIFQLLDKKGREAPSR